MKYTVKLSGIVIAILFAQVVDASADDEHRPRKSSATSGHVHANEGMTKTAGLLDIFRPASRRPLSRQPAHGYSAYRYQPSASSRYGAPYQSNYNTRSLNTRNFNTRNFNTRNSNYRSNPASYRNDPRTSRGYGSAYNPMGQTSRYGQTGCPYSRQSISPGYYGR